MTGSVAGMDGTTRTVRVDGVVVTLEGVARPNQGRRCDSISFPDILKVQRTKARVEIRVVPPTPADPTKTTRYYNIVTVPVSWSKATKTR
jgi:hypothetical protein